MIEMKIGENSHYLEKLLNILSQTADTKVFPITDAALKEGAEKIRGVWIERAMQHPLAGKYINTIRAKQTGPFTHEIYTDADEADWIENGTRDLDMKKTHPYGPRSRVSKKGVSYVIIPFRWGSPGGKRGKRVGFGKNVMDAGTYKIVQKYKKMASLISPSNAPDDKKTPNAKGESVGRATYNKSYDRLAGMLIEGSIEQKTRMTGMVRSTDETGKDRSGGYFTFRVISAKSLAGTWERRGMPAQSVVKGVKEIMQEPIDTMVEAAMKGDLEL